MHLQRDLLYAIVRSELDGLLPVGDEHVVPLIHQRIGEVRRPGAGDPVGRLVLRRAAGAAGEGDDRLDAQLFSQTAGVEEIVVVALGHFGVGMHAVAVRGERGDFKAVVGNDRLELFELRGVVEQNVRIAVALARAAAGADFQRLYAGISQVLARVLEGHAIKRNRQNTKFHGKNLLHVNG